jgi:hypothetical protein
VALAAWLAACPSPPAPVPPSLLLSARPARIANDGTTTTLRVEAADADGGLGSGAVLLSAPAGQFPDGTTVTLDSNGAATARFACDVVADVGCAAKSVKLTASWTPHGDAQEATTTVTLVAPLPDGGVDAGVAPRPPCTIGPDGGAWLDVEPLSDWAAYDAPNHLVVTNVQEHALDVLDVTSGRAASRVVLGGTPARLAVNVSAHTALVVHGLTGPARLDVVDVSAQTFTSIPLSFQGTSFQGLDVAFGPAGTAYVLTSSAWMPNQDAVILDVDLAGLAVRAQLNVNAGSKTTSFSGPRLGFGAGTFVFGNERLRAADAGVGWALETAFTVASLFDFPNHLRLAPDGNLLYPTLNNSVTEYALGSGAVAHRYALVTADAIDVAFSHDGTMVGALVPKNGELWTFAFDRASQAQLGTTLAGGWAQTYPRQLVEFSSDDHFLFVYAATVSPAVSRVMCTPAR